MTITVSEAIVRWLLAQKIDTDEGLTSQEFMPYSVMEMLLD